MKLGKMFLTGNAHAIKTKSVLIYTFMDMRISLLLQCRRRDILEISLDYERWRMGSHIIIS